MTRRKIIYGSICSGIEAATAAWHPLGWQPAFFSEIEAAPRAVLAHHYPTVPLHGDFTTIKAGDYEPIDLLVGGTPCQDFSVAGLRAGLTGERGNLTLEFVRLVDRLRPQWLVWENVPGVLSIDGGRAFGAFLGGLAQLGYGFAYRILDAQFFGVPQRRRRVFVVGYLGDWRRAAAVLFERESLSGNPPPRREAGTRAPAGTLGGTSPGGRWRFGADEAAAGQLIAPRITSNPYGDHESREGLLVAFGGNDTRGPIDVATAVNAHGGPHGRQDFESETFVAFRTSPNCGVWETGDRIDALTTGTDQTSSILAFSSKDSGADAGDTAPTLRAMGHSGSHANAGGQIAVAFQEAQTGVREYADAGTLRSNGPGHDPVGTRLRIGSAVRRLTPMECERLQGFPDGYTAVPMRGKPMADGPRYKMLGNSMAVPCMAWIGRRIEMVRGLAPDDAAVPAKKRVVA